MELLENIQHLSFLSLSALVFMVVAGIGMVLFMTNLIPGFGMMAEETRDHSTNENLPDGEEKIND